MEEEKASALKVDLCKLFSHMKIFEMHFVMFRLTNQTLSEFNSI